MFRAFVPIWPNEGWREERMNRWYVAQTHRRDEEKAAWHLRRQEFSVYLPRYLTRRRHARRVDPRDGSPWIRDRN